ncbi:MAG: ABC transporter ATP-binding protein [Cytophagaceae bacterium]
MKTFLRILQYARPYGKYGTPYFIYSILATIFGLVNFAFIMPILDLLFNSTKSIDSFTMPEPAFSINYFKGLLDYLTAGFIKDYGRSNTLIIIALFLIVTNFLANAFRYFSLTINSKVRATVVYNIRKALFDKIIQLDIGYFTNQRKGDLMSRLTSDLHEIENSAIGALQMIFRDPFNLTIYFVALFLIQWKLMLFTLLILPVAGIVVSMIGKRLKKQSNESQQSMGHILSVMDEAITGIRIIKGFLGEAFTFSRFDKLNHYYAKLNRSMGYKRDLASPLTEFLGVTIASIILFMGGNMVFNGELEASVFFLFIISFYRILEPIKSISSSLTSIQRGIAAGDRVFAIIDEEIQIQNAPHATTLKSFNTSIEYKGVNFSYGDKPILKNIHLTIPKGHIVALVGPSGGGKSTLVDLLPRFQDSGNGQILIDGQSIKSIDITSLRSYIGIVTQESILFNDTIYNNIAFGQTNITQADVERAAKIANAHDFILQTEEGYQTNIGERGMKLSGGQRQRISIARAVLKNPEILILDEATSALDNESEKLVQEALNNVMQNRTAIVIAHRLSTIRHANTIVVLDKGEIVEMGSHEELMHKQGAYFLLHQHADKGIIG